MSFAEKLYILKVLYRDWTFSLLSQSKTALQQLIAIPVQ